MIFIGGGCWQMSYRYVLWKVSQRNQDVLGRPGVVVGGGWGVMGDRCCGAFVLGGGSTYDRPLLMW